MDEILAENQLDKLKGKQFRYEGKDADWTGSVGTFSSLEDMNCCAPTLDVLYTFTAGTRRKVMAPGEFLAFVQDCSEVPADQD